MALRDGSRATARLVYNKERVDPAADEPALVLIADLTGQHIICTRLCVDKPVPCANLQDLVKAAAQGHTFCVVFFDHCIIGSVIREIATDCHGSGDGRPAAAWGRALHNDVAFIDRNPDALVMKIEPPEFFPEATPIGEPSMPMDGDPRGVTPDGIAYIKKLRDVMHGSSSAR